MITIPNPQFSHLQHSKPLPHLILAVGCGIDIISVTWLKSWGHLWLTLQLFLTPTPIHSPNLFRNEGLIWDTSLLATVSIDIALLWVKKIIKGTIQEIFCHLAHWLREVISALRLNQGQPMSVCFLRSSGIEGVVNILFYLNQTPAFTCPE